MSRNLAFKLYQLFLVLLLISQVYPIFLETSVLFDEVSHYVVSIYILFRLYMFIRLNGKAKILDLTLTEFFDKRNI